MPSPTNPQTTALSLGGAHRFARCWKITAVAGTFRFTDHDLSLEVDGELYVPGGGLGGSAAQTSMESGQDNVTVNGVVSSGAITDEDLLAGRFENAQVEEFTVDHRFPFAGKFRRRVYRIGRTRHNPAAGVWEAELVGFLGQLNRQVGSRYSKRCGWTLYDPDTCAVVKASFTTTITVTAVNADGSFEATPAAFDQEDFFEDGECSWSSGSNSGTSQSVASYDTTTKTWVLYEAPFETIEVGDQASVSAGCNKLSGMNVDGTEDLTGHCKHKFDNLARFGGRPYLPTDDLLYLTPNAKRDE